MAKRKRQNADQQESAAQECAGTDSPDVVHNGESRSTTSNFNDPLPRPQRRRRRARADRGLPPDEELAKLAKAFLERQRKHWPKIFEAGLLPEPTEIVICEMVEDFKMRHRTASVNIDGLGPFLEFAQKLGGSYNRYSSDNSSPTSVLDQMINGLDKAHAERRFIPWQYVFADYSVTGLDASRQGYTSFKVILAHKAHLIETVYIDDFSRASRDELEWWKLAATCKRLNKRMIGASDGFDLSSPDWDLRITIYGLLSRLFIKSLQEKVRRGMRGAARRGTSLGKQSLGFTRRIHQDENGREVRDREGLPVFEPCIDPVTFEFRLLMFQLFLEKNMSAFKIARHFNQLKVDAWNGWTESAIKSLLKSPTAIGVFIWNKSRREYDWEQEKMVVVRNPRNVWEVHYDRTLAIVPMEMWRAARRKLAASRRASPLTGRKPSKNQVCATTILSGTLFCAYCKQELKLIRSTEKYKQVGCLCGLARSHNCKLSSSKSLRIVEECLLGYLRDTILNDDQVVVLVGKANAEIERQARQPQVNSAPLKAAIRKLDAKIRKLVLLIEDEADKNLCVAHNNRIKELQKELNSLAAKVRDADRAKLAPIGPLTVESVKAYLANFRELLNQEIPVAAEAIRLLTGPIEIRQEPIPGRKGGNRWIASFSPDLMRVVRHLTRGQEAIASQSIDTNLQPQAIEVVIDKVPKYETLAPLFKQLHDNGASVESIASAHGLSWGYTDDILKFAETGERPNWGRYKKSKAGGRFPPSRYKEIAKEVVRLRKLKMPFLRIAETLKEKVYTVRRAYDFARPEAVQRAAETGARPERGRHMNIGERKYAEVQFMLRKGERVKVIADKVGCGASTIYRIRRQMRADGEAA